MFNKFDFSHIFISINNLKLKTNKCQTQSHNSPPTQQKVELINIAMAATTKRLKENIGLSTKETLNMMKMSNSKLALVLAANFAQKMLVSLMCFFGHATHFNFECPVCATSVRFVPL